METLPLIVFLPLAVGFVLLFVPNKSRLPAKVVTLAASALAFVLSVQIFITRPDAFQKALFEIGSFKMDLLLRCSPLNAFILMFACGFGLLITIYSLKTLSEQVGRFNEFYGSILLAIGGSAGILLTDHLLFLLIFWEIVTAALYILIAAGGKDCKFAATKTFAMIGASDAAFLLGLAITWLISGTFVISQVQIPTDSALAIIAFLLLMTAAVTKAGAMPLHTWLPTSGETAPASVMALLPAAIDKLLGIYLLVLVVKSMFIMQHGALSLVLTIIGSATIILAVMVAMVQHNLKKLLSYHAVSQVGYMVLGIGTLTPVGMAGGLFHMLNHAIYKCCLFLCAGAVEQKTGTTELDELGGLGNKMTITFLACMTAALSISGIPPLNGFVSKWMVYQGVIELGNKHTGIAAQLWPVWLVAALFGSALTLASFVKILHSVFLSRLPKKLENVTEVSPLATGPMVVLATLCIFFGVFYKLPLNWFIYPALGIEPGAAILSTWESVLATAMLFIGIGFGLIIVLVALASVKARTVPTWYCGEKRENEEMIIPGSHFYKTVSSMRGLKQLYRGQEKGYFDLYNLAGKLGLAVTFLLKKLHNGVLPNYLTWVTLGLLIILFAVCGIW